MKFAILMAHKKVLALGLTTVAAGSLALGTMLSGALFTDTETDNSTFTAGTIILDATKIAAMDLTSAAMMPGDTQISPVVVENDGSATLRYAVSHTSTDADTKDLRGQLTVVVKGPDSDQGDSLPCDDNDGTSIHASTTLGAASNLVGDPTQGGQAGDRTLTTGTNETLCFYVSLPLAATNAAQGATTTTTFTFAAEQTSNNP